MQTLPLDQLMLSKLNVRQTERDADIVSLAEDIAARGLKQNLVVIPAHYASGEAESDWEGRFEVIAGGRRFQAMQLLVEDGRLPADHAVNCLIEERADASETSLSENLHRVAMNPADEFDAFRQIVEDADKRGEADPVAYCAKRFGVTVKHVQGRLRLASLAPEILEALRSGAIGLESAKAYAGTEDHELQLKVFKAQAKSNWKPHDAAAVRQALRGETVGLTDGRVKFVGIDAYREAGGRVEVEMFMGTDGEERVTDIKLLDKLAKEKAEPLVGPQAKKDGFKSGLLSNGFGSNAKWPKVPEGMERHVRYCGEKEPTKTQLKKCVAVYALCWDGSGIECAGHYRPIQAKAKVEERDWAAERAADERTRKVTHRAAQMAVYGFGKFAGTPFEGRAFWPSYNIRPVEDDRDEGDETFAMVAIQIRVPVADIEAHRAEAERLIDEEAAAAEAANAKLDEAESEDTCPVAQTIEPGDEIEPDGDGEFANEDEVQADG